jgi:response regulator RpfG family c-di-GMP phosphodiesterase
MCMESDLRLLLVEDSADDAQLILRAVRKAGYQPVYRQVQTLADIQQALDEQDWDAIIADYTLPQLDATTTLAEVQRRNLDLPFLIVSGAIDEERAVGALRAGAHDFMSKGNLARLGPALARELREAEERRMRRAAEQAVTQQQARAATLIRIAGRLNTSLDLATVTAAVCTSAIDALHLPVAGVALYDTECNRFRVINVQGIPQELLAGILPVPRLYTNFTPVQIFADARVLLHELGISASLPIDLRTIATAELRCRGQLVGILAVASIGATQMLTSDDSDLLQGLADQAAVAIDNARLVGDLQQARDELEIAYDATLEGWVHALDLRDKETEGHTQRVTRLSVRLGRAMGLSEAELVHLRRGALLHDIGKLGIPDAILHKPGALTPDEWHVMRRHPVYAYEWLAPITYLQPALAIPWCHHERWDGSGYPRGLAGNAIPLAARIFAVVDVWDAMTNDRPYHRARSAQEVCTIITAESGRHFDPAVVAAFLQLLAESA